MATQPVLQSVRDEAEPLLSTIGNTPLLCLERTAAEFPGVRILAKAEYFNPGGSVKDRAALNMILDGERSGRLHHGRVILDSTSGNTGIAYAMIAAARGYRVKLVLPANASLERKRILKAYGAEVVYSDAGDGSDGAIRLCREIYRQDPDFTFIPISTIIRPTGRRTSNIPAPRSSARPAARSPTSWPPSGRVAPSPA